MIQNGYKNTLKWFIMIKQALDDINLYIKDKNMHSRGNQGRQQKQTNLTNAYYYLFIIY